MAKDYTGFQEQGVNLTKADIRKKQLEVIEIYKKSLADVRKKIERLYSVGLDGIKPENYYNHVIKFNRLDKLEKAILKDLTALNKQVNLLTAQASALSYSNNYYRMQYATNWLSPYRFTKASENAVNYSVFQDLDSFKKLSQQYQRLLEVQSGLTLSKTLTSNNTKSVQKVSQALTQSLIQGKSFTQTAKEIRSSFNGNLADSLRVVRTESHRTLNQGELIQWNDAKAQGVEGTRQIISTLDTRTRRQSGQVDGRRENEFGLFNYPEGRTGENGVSSPGNSGKAKWDINDRETVINIIAGESPQLRRGRNPSTGENEVFTYRDFNTWTKENNLKYNKSGRLVETSK